MSNRIVPPSFKRGAWTLPVQLAALTLIALALALGLAPRVSADPTPVTIANQNMEGALKLLPGDIIAVGYIFRVQKPHPAIELRLSDPVLTVKYRCANDAVIRRFYVTVVEGRVPVQPIAQDIEQWAPTKDLNLADGFQLSYKVEDACGGRALIVDSSTGGVDFSANVGGSQPITNVELKFHYRVPRAKGFTNINCADPVQNPPPGKPACTANWSASTIAQAGFVDPTVGWGGQIVANVNGVVFVDSNGNGARDAGEAGLPGVRIEVVDAQTGVVVNSQLTWNYPNSPYHGRYGLTVPKAGTYIVRQPQQPAGYTSTTPNQATLVVLDGQGTVYDFGEQPSP